MSTQHKQARDEWITPDEACAILKVSRRTLRSYVARGTVQAYRLKGNTRVHRYKRGEVEDLLVPIPTA